MAHFSRLSSLMGSDRLCLCFLLGFFCLSRLPHGSRAFCAGADQISGYAFYVSYKCFATNPLRHAGSKYIIVYNAYINQSHPISLMSNMLRANTLHPIAFRSNSSANCLLAFIGCKLVTESYN